MGLSGKCDFQDTVEIYGADNIINNFRIYAGEHRIVPLAFKEPKDLIPYYPYIVGLMCKNNDSGTIWLAEESFIDSEERSWLEWDLEYLKRYWKRCKRKKVPWDDAEAKKLISFYNWELPEHKKQLVERVKTFGKKATIKGLHDPSHDNMRKELYDLMVSTGWDDDISYRWVYGWDRWLDREREKKDEGNN